MNIPIYIALSSSLGSSLQELIYWYSLRHKLEEKQYAELARSLGYWIIVSLMVLGAGLTAIVWFNGEPTPRLKDAFAFGVGLPLLIKQLGSTTKEVHFGSSAVRHYFNAG